MTHTHARTRTDKANALAAHVNYDMGFSYENEGKASSDKREKKSKKEKKSTKKKKSKGKDAANPIESIEQVSRRFTHP